MPMYETDNETTNAGAIDTKQRGADAKHRTSLMVPFPSKEDTCTGAPVKVGNHRIGYIESTSG